MEPAVGIQHLGSSLGVLVIAHHHRIAPDAQLPLVQLVLPLGVAQAHRVDVGRVLGVVPGAVPHRLGEAVHLADEEARLHQVGHGVGIHGRRAAGQGLQAAQTVPAAPHHIPVDGLEQHRHHRHHLAVHGSQVPVEVLQVVAQVDGVAHDSPGDGAGEGCHVEHGQHREGAEFAGVPAGLLLNVLKGQAEEIHGGKQIPVADHDTLAAAGGAGGKENHRQSVHVLALTALVAPLGFLVAVQGQQLVPISLGEGGLPVGELSVVDDVNRLHQVDLVVDPLPALLEVQGHQHAPRQQNREQVHQIIIAVAGQQADLPALDVGAPVQQKPRCLADVLGVLPVADAHHAALCLVKILNRGLLGQILFHIVDQLVYCRDHIVPSSCLFCPPGQSCLYYIRYRSPLQPRTGCRGPTCNTGIRRAYHVPARLSMPAPDFPGGFAGRQRFSPFPPPFFRRGGIMAAGLAHLSMVQFFPFSWSGRNFCYSGLRAGRLFQQGKINRPNQIDSRMKKHYTRFEQIFDTNYWCDV